jgi:hypothetical protein
MAEAGDGWLSIEDKSGPDSEAQLPVEDGSLHDGSVPNISPHENMADDDSVCLELALGSVNDGSGGGDLRFDLLEGDTMLTDAIWPCSVTTLCYYEWPPPVDIIFTAFIDSQLEQTHTVSEVRIYANMKAEATVIYGLPLAFFPLAVFSMCFTSCAYHLAYISDRL